MKRLQALRMITRSTAVSRIFVMIVIFIIAMIFVPRFATSGNLYNLVRNIFLLCLVGYGMSLSMIIGGIDLSIGSVAALATVLGASLILKGYVLPGILTTIAVGGGLGLLNGVMIARLKIPDFIMTFSLLYIARGLALSFTQGQAFYNYPESFKWIGKSSLGPIPVPVIISAIVLLLLYFLLNHTVFGRAVYAVGANKKAANYSGISVQKKVTQIYMISGLLAALAGLIYIARLNSADADLGMNWPLEAIAVCVIGGVTFAGGEGQILGLLMGGSIMAIINNCINLIGIPSRFQDFFVGFVIILAVTVDHFTKRRNE